MLIRKIQKTDEADVAHLIRSVLVEHDVPKVGTAYADPQLDCMFDTYSQPNSVYFVVVEQGRIIGGAGVGPLSNAIENICELQKMYLLAEARGVGIGEKIMQMCLDAAKEFGYEKCYLETMPCMKAAQKLYRKSKFEYLCEPVGNTGHSACQIWMIKNLR